MTISDDIPSHVIQLMKSTFSLEFATITKAGVPIDTPTLSFPSEDLSTMDVATGLAYPAKAERLRQNPKSGLWIDGILPGEPTISIRGFGATKDRDVQENSIRYIKEIGSYGVGMMAPWDVEQKAVWYWARILMCIAPQEILWWDSPEDFDKPPHRWVAPSSTQWPASDPKPEGPTSKAPKWPQPDWTELADAVMERNEIGHVSLVDEDGFPRPIKAINIERVEDGFVFDIPKFAPGNRTGAASLSFRGKENFIGSASEVNGRVHFSVERALPILPFVSDPNEQWEPKPETRKAIMERLETELARRGQNLPVIPDTKPEPTSFGKLRAERFGRLMEHMNIPELD